MKSVGLILVAVSFAGFAAAQTPSVNTGGIVNVASYAFAGLPNGDIAQGSMVTIFGSNLGPATLVSASSFPLPTTLGNTSVKVTSGSATAQAILFFVSAGQIAAVIPSSLPTGNASLTVTTGGGTSAPANFKIVAASFGVFAANGGGTGPGIIANADGQLYGAATAANPGDAAVIWGTGLGPVSGDEAGGALPGDMPSVPVEVYVNNVKANVTYRGRSGCCVGIDQIVFTVPENITGCHVSVALKINNVVSNYTTMAIAPKGTRTCSDPNGISSADQQKFATNGAAIGVVALSRLNISISVPILGTINTSTDTGFASFFKYSALQYNTAGNPLNSLAYGTCMVTQTKANTSGVTDPVIPTSLDAGAAITVSGSGGTKTMPKTTSVGVTTYLSTFGTSMGSPGFLEAGNFTISGSGGSGVGAFSTSLTIPAPLNWTNQNSISSVNRGAGQLITWSGGDPNGAVIVAGNSTATASSDSPTVTFNCFAKASDGQFMIPAAVLLNLPVSASVQGVPLGSIFVGTNTTPKTFTATGLDYAIAVGTVDSFKTLGYQ